jgi:RNA polymerase sigma-54 factor
MVEAEDPKKPLTDQEIVEALKVKSIEIARRTVAKYRAWLNIPSASKRKKPF